MSKILIDDLLDETSFLSDANLRFQQVEDEFNNKVLYRVNPDGEPNGMFNALDMQLNDILNTNIIHAQALFINGIIVDGSPPIWGTIDGDLPDQEDLDLALQDAHDFGIWDVGIKEENVFEILQGGAARTELALEWIREDDKVPELSFTAALNSLKGGLITLNGNGQIPPELISESLTNIIGFFRADDICLNKPAPCAEPDHRNPSQIDGLRVFNNGEAYITFFGEGETEGSIDLVNPQDPLGLLITVEIFDGDAIVYLDEVPLFTQAGWYLWKNAVIVNVASNVTYNADTVATDNKSIQIISDDVQSAIDDLDNNTLTLSEFLLDGLLVPVPQQQVAGEVAFNNILTVNGTMDIESNVKASDTTVLTLDGETLVPNIDKTDAIVPNLRQAVDYDYVKDLKDTVSLLAGKILVLENKLLGIPENAGALNPGTVILDTAQRVSEHNAKEAEASAGTLGRGHVSMAETSPGVLTIDILPPTDPTP